MIKQRRYRAKSDRKPPKIGGGSGEREGYIFDPNHAHSIIIITGERRLPEMLYGERWRNVRRFLGGGSQNQIHYVFPDKDKESDAPHPAVRSLEIFKRGLDKGLEKQILHHSLPWESGLFGLMMTTAIRTTKKPGEEIPTWRDAFTLIHAYQDPVWVERPWKSMMEILFALSDHDLVGTLLGCP